MSLSDDFYREIRDELTARCAALGLTVTTPQPPPPVEPAPPCARCGRLEFRQKDPVDGKWYCYGWPASFSNPNRCSLAALPKPKRARITAPEPDAGSNPA